MHVLEGGVVRPSEPSSVVACLLSTAKYHEYVSADDAGGGAMEADRRKRQHFSLMMRDSTCEFFCEARFAREFWRLRQRMLGGDEPFIKSLRRCYQFSAQGGKSGALFSRTLDGRFLIKQIRSIEMELFSAASEFAPQYFQYLEGVCDEVRRCAHVFSLAALVLLSRSVFTFCRRHRHDHHSTRSPHTVNIVHYMVIFIVVGIVRGLTPNAAASISTCKDSRCFPDWLEGQAVQCHISAGDNCHGGSVLAAPHSARV